MKRLFTQLVVLGFACCSLGTPKTFLQTDLSDALAAARQKQKLILLNFTSPAADWCQSCRNFDAEVCRTTEFQTYVQTNFVVVVVDELQAASTGEQSTITALEEKHEINSWPTLIVLDAKGSSLGRVVGYSRGAGCAKAILELEKIRLRK